MLRRCFTSVSALAVVTTAWLAVNTMLFQDLAPAVWAANCNVGAISNTTDCATTNNVVCATWCNNVCVNANGKLYSGNAHGVQVSGSSQFDSSPMIHCWYSYPCVNVFLVGYRCRQSPTGSWYCDGNHPLENCRYCEAGAAVSNTIADYKVKACDEE